MDHPKVEGVLGVSQAMRQVEMLLRRVADIEGSLLITGESGVGKEVAAKFIHQISARADEPFVPVDCAAETLLEGELFGHERAAARHHGFVERAGNGILFLDEIAALPNWMQAKLLRLVQERAFTRLGGETVIKSGARIIFATSADLEAYVAEGHFHRGLYDRINVIAVAIPPLRNRTDDILPYAQRFVHEFAERNFRCDVRGFTAEAEQALLQHAWPGNVYELRNRVERAVRMSAAALIDAEGLFPEFSTVSTFPTLKHVRDRVEREQIRAALREADRREIDGNEPPAGLPPAWMLAVKKRSS
jgi:DNA-binding NtrC family response regulator